MRSDKTLRRPLAAISQVVLYTVLRPWITDVPEAFALTAGQDSYLTLLVLFHLATLVLVTLLLRTQRRGVKK